MSATDESPAPSPITDEPDGTRWSRASIGPAPLPDPTPAEAYGRYEQALTRGRRRPSRSWTWTPSGRMRRTCSGAPAASRSGSPPPCARAAARPRPRVPGRPLLHAVRGALALGEGAPGPGRRLPHDRRGCLTRLARITSEHPDEAPAVMVDRSEHLDLIEEAAASSSRRSGSRWTSTFPGGPSAACSRSAPSARRSAPPRRPSPSPRRSSGASG